MQYILSFLLFFIAVILVLYSIYALRYRPSSQISNPFAGFMLMLALYAGGYAEELLSPTLDRMIFWSTFQYIGISFIPFLWISLTARYVNAPFFRIRRVRIVLLAFSCITLFGALTDPRLHLKYASVSIIMEPGFPVLRFTPGPLYIFHVFYIVSALTAGIVLLVHSLLSTCRFFRKTLILMIVGSSLPYLNFILYLMNIRFPGIDTIPFSMFFSALCCGPAIFSEKLLDAVPVARSLIFEMISDAVIVLDGRNRISDYNKAAATLFPGITDGKTPVQELPEAAERTGATEFQTDIPCGTETRRFSCHISRIYKDKEQCEPEGKILLFKDITDSARLLEKTKELATIDPLTELYNRRYFFEQAGRIMAVQEHTYKKISFIIADLDLFKQINDTYGHLTGDAAIQAAASAFASFVHTPDITARFGGEEFVCLLPDTDAASAFTVAEQIRKRIEQIPFPFGKEASCTTAAEFCRQKNTPPGQGRQAFITASFGIADTETGCDGQDITTLISRADKALYHSKNTGRNRTSIG